MSNYTYIFSPSKEEEVAAAQTLAQLACLHQPPATLSPIPRPHTPATLPVDPSATCLTTHTLKHPDHLALQSWSNRLDLLTLSPYLPSPVPSPKEFQFVPTFITKSGRPRSLHPPRVKRTRSGDGKAGKIATEKVTTKGAGKAKVSRVRMGELDRLAAYALAAVAKEVEEEERRKRQEEEAITLTAMEKTN